VNQPTAGPLTPRETRLAEALVALVDYTGRVLLTALADTSPPYLADKAAGLADAARRVAELTREDHSPTRRGPACAVRLPAVADAVAAWSQPHTAGRMLFPQAARTPRRPQTGR
jgi:hypothetical protein